MDIREEIELAKKARLNAYSPYSNYKVGACLKCKNGNRYIGTNIENFGIQSICAERSAFCAALSNGEREFDYIVVVGGKEELEKCLPCGYCRQFMNEFGDENFRIYAVYGDVIEEYSISDLLPQGFKL